MCLAMPRDAARRGSAPWSYQEQLLAQSAKLSLPLSSVRGFGGSTPMRDKKPRCATAKRMPVPRQGVEIGAGLKKEYLTMKEQIFRDRSRVRNQGRHARATHKHFLAVS